MSSLGRRAGWITLATLGVAIVAGIGASVPAAAISQTYIVVLQNSVNDPAQAAVAQGLTPTPRL